MAGTDVFTKRTGHGNSRDSERVKTSRRPFAFLSGLKVGGGFPLYRPLGSIVSKKARYMAKYGELENEGKKGVTHLFYAGLGFHFW